MKQPNQLESCRLRCEKLGRRNGHLTSVYCLRLMRVVLEMIEVDLVYVTKNDLLTKEREIDQIPNGRPRSELLPAHAAFLPSEG
jgi:hypothetical protein